MRRRPRSVQTLMPSVPWSLPPFESASTICALSRLYGSEERGDLTIHGTFFDIGDGLLRVLDPESGSFSPVSIFEEQEVAA